MKLQSTYVITFAPIDKKLGRLNRSLIRETAEPYLYKRTTKDNRLIVGREDEEFQNPKKRDDILRNKIKILERKFRHIYPKIDFKTKMVWCGTFSSTSDGLPNIGPWKKDSRTLFALGYGENGITFAMIAAQTLKKIVF